MASARSDLENEMHSWLKVALKGEKLKDLSFDILGNTEKGDGYMGDIMFLSARGTAEDGSSKEYNLILKCSKKGQVFRETMPVKDIFLNEIYAYANIIPDFINMQKESGIEDIFDNTAKYYGSFVGENMEVIALENLKTLGFEMWPRKQPLTRKHIDLVMEAYGKLHASSFAMEKHDPIKFQEYLLNLKDFSIDSKIDTEPLFQNAMDETCELLKNDLDEATLLKWTSFKNQINFVMKEMPLNITGLKVILQGDCHNGNFMYLHKNGEASKVALLDWQTAKYSSPILDLSYFLFLGISKEDLENLDDILATYYKTFISYLKKLHVNEPEKLYPFTQFMDEWKSYCKHGIMMTSLMKILCMESDEAPDVRDAMESGKEFGQIFQVEIRDIETYKKRLRPIIEYVVKHELI